MIKLRYWPLQKKRKNGGNKSICDIRPPRKKKENPISVLIDELGGLIDVAFITS